MNTANIRYFFNIYIAWPNKFTLAKFLQGFVKSNTR